MEKQFEELITLIKSGSPDVTEVRVCENCQISLQITVSKSAGEYEVSPANLPHAPLIIDFAEERKLFEKNETAVIMARCVCFTVTDPSGTRNECFICHEPPDVRCYGPYAYCPSTRSVYKIDKNLGDGSESYIRVYTKTDLNYACTQFLIFMLSNSHSSSRIRVNYMKSNSSLYFEKDVNPNSEESLNCAWGVTLKILKTQYIS